MLLYINISLISRVAEALILGTMLVGQAVAFAPNYSKARVAASQIFNLLDRQPAIDTSPGVGLRLVSGSYIILLHDFLFTHSSSRLTS